MTMTKICNKCGNNIVISRNNFSGDWSDKGLKKCNCNNGEFYKKHFEDLAEQHRKKYEYYKNKAKQFANEVEGDAE